MTTRLCGACGRPIPDGGSQHCGLDHAPIEQRTSNPGGFVALFWDKLSGALRETPSPRHDIKLYRSDEVDAYLNARATPSETRASETPAPTRERLLDLATELARYFTSGNPVPVERATIRRESDLYLLLRECMPAWEFERPALKANEGQS